MKIVKLTAENLKRLEVVEIAPDGGVVQITGKNGSGKSSLLDAIFYALAGGGVLPHEPIRRGATSAKVVLDLGELVITKKFTDKGPPSLVVEAASGARFKGPQGVIDELVGAISFDPGQFVRMKPKEQFDMLRQVSKIAVDLDALAGKRARFYDTRTELNRDATRLRAQAETLRLPSDLPATAIDVAALLTLMQEGSETNSLIERRTAGRASAAQKIVDLRARADDLDGEVGPLVARMEGNRDISKAAAKARYEDELRRIDEQSEAAIADARSTRTVEAGRIRHEAGVLQARFDGAEALPATVDLTELRAKIEQARTWNEMIAKRDAQKKIAAEAAAFEERALAMTQSIDALDAEKEAAIKAAKMPVDDISFGDGIVLYKGLPFEQASGAEQLRVSVAVAMAANPKLRVMLIRDGGLLDDDGMQLLRDMAVAADYQIWVESVHANGPITVEMVDGRVKGAVAA